MSPSKVPEKNITSSPLQKPSIKNILCPVDFSEFSGRALRYAAGLSQHFNARLYVLHSAELPDGMRAGPVPSAVREWEDRIPQFEHNVEKMLAANYVLSANAEVIVKEGIAAQQILQTIADHRIDLLVMGTHGHQGFTRFALGSVAEDLIHRAICPTLVISHPEHDFARPELPDGVQMKTILVATDFSSYSERALTHALRWAHEWSARVILTHVVTDSPFALRGVADFFSLHNPYFEREMENARQVIQRILPHEEAECCHVKYQLRQGHAADEILKAAEENGADMIVMGARGASTSSGPWGSVSSAVVRAGTFPVLVVRELELSNTCTAQTCGWTAVPNEA